MKIPEEELKALSEFKIKKGIPIPVGGKGGGKRYPWKEMEIGDSIFVPANGEDLTRIVMRLGQSMAGAAPFRFTRRRDNTNNGVRVWRIE